jgi:hypothetical protein
MNWFLRFIWIEMNIFHLNLRINQWSSYRKQQQQYSNKHHSLFNNKNSFTNQIDMLMFFRNVQLTIENHHSNGNFSLYSEEYFLLSSTFSISSNILHNYKIQFNSKQTLRQIFKLGNSIEKLFEEKFVFIFKKLIKEKSSCFSQF